MQSDGNAIGAELARLEPVRTILSGPAAGVVGAASLARAFGVDRFITFDMGGTSTDVSLFDGRANIRSLSYPAGYPVRTPVIDIHTVGAGGGSLARVDEGGSLKVGPESAGADPGPACYGHGEEPTVTDADLIAGRLMAANFLGGRMRLFPDRAMRAIGHLSRAMKCGADAAALGVIRVVNANMARAVRLITVERGFDPRHFALLAFGGAGPMHACELAAELGIHHVILPRNPGLACAYGALNAALGREYSLTVRQAAPSYASLLKAARPLMKRARAEMAAQGVRASLLRIALWADLRYRGQSFELKVALTPRFIEDFHREHQRAFGYAAREAAVEVVNVRLQISAIDYAHRPSRHRPRLARARADRSNRCAGREPAAVDPGISARTTGRGNPHQRPIAAGRTQRHRLCIARVHLARRRFWQYPPGVPSVKLDPVTLEVMNSRLAAIAEEMGVVLGQTGYSPNIKERRDFSCALFDGRGEMVAQAAHLPVHLGSTPLSVRAAIERLTLAPGDVAVVNDPFAGGTHLPDLTMVEPVFIPRRRQPFAFVANRAHHADIGGMAPGSMALSSEIYQEGFRLPPVKLMAGGKPVRDIFELFFANTRVREEREGDLRAQIGALAVGRRRMLEVVRTLGPALVGAAMEELKSYSARLMKAALAKLAEGTYEAEDFLDDDGFGTGPIRLRVAIRIKDGRARVDFAGSAPQVRGPVNANYAITLSAVFYVMKCLGAAAVPPNEGLMRAVEVIAPPGTIVNANAPAAVAGGNVETSQRLVDVLFKALAQAAPDRIPAASSGSMSNLTVGGYDASRETPVFLLRNHRRRGRRGARDSWRVRDSHPHDQHPEHADRSIGGLLSDAGDAIPDPPRFRGQGKIQRRRRFGARTGMPGGIQRERAERAPRAGAVRSQWRRRGKARRQLRGERTAAAQAARQNRHSPAPRRTDPNRNARWRRLGQA